MTRLFEAKPFLIAEVGSNWQTLDHCLESIRVAKECGANACKFQAFTHEALYGWPSMAEECAKGYGNDPGVVVKGQLNLAWLPQLKAECDRVGLEFMCTAFSPELLAQVDPYVEVHKIASSDAAWPQMLEAAGRTGKPVLVSTGAKNGRDIDRANKVLSGKHIPHIPMYCCAEYPADFVDLTWVRAWTKNGVWAGFSDHTLGFTATVEAVKYGAKVIEKHFTAFPDLDTPDRQHSLDSSQFKRMVNLIRRLKPDYVSALYEEGRQQLMHLRANRRLIATRDVQAGDVLTYGENFGAYRSLVDDIRGASPFDWEQVQGRRARGPIARGSAIALGDVE